MDNGQCTQNSPSLSLPGQGGRDGTTNLDGTLRSPYAALYICRAAVTACHSLSSKLASSLSSDEKSGCILDRILLVLLICCLPTKDGVWEMLAVVLLGTISLWLRTKGADWGIVEQKAGDVPDPAAAAAAEEAHAAAAATTTRAMHISPLLRGLTPPAPPIRVEL